MRRLYKSILNEIKKLEAGNKPYIISLLRKHFNSTINNQTQVQLLKNKENLEIILTFYSSLRNQKDLIKLYGNNIKEQDKVKLSAKLVGLELPKEYQK